MKRKPKLTHRTKKENGPAARRRFYGEALHIGGSGKAPLLRRGSEAPPWRAWRRYRHFCGVAANTAALWWARRGAPLLRRGGEHRRSWRARKDATFAAAAETPHFCGRGEERRFMLRRRRSGGAPRQLRRERRRGTLLRRGGKHRRSLRQWRTPPHLGGSGETPLMEAAARSAALCWRSRGDAAFAAAAEEHGSFLVFNSILSYFHFIFLSFFFYSGPQTNQWFDFQLARHFRLFLSPILCPRPKFSSAWPRGQNICPRSVLHQERSCRQRSDWKCCSCIPRQARLGP